MTKYRVRVVSVLACLLVLVALGAGGVGQDGTSPADQPSRESGISGMVRLEGSTFLLVNDRKHPRDAGVRLSVLTVEDESVDEQPLALDGMEGLDAPSDLEAACAVPGEEGEYLLAESGYFEGEYGRIFHVRIAQDQGAWTATVLSTFAPFDRPDTADGSTPKAQQIEGMACVRTGDDVLVLILARRGGASTAATLVWGPLDLESPRPSFVQWAEAKLTGSAGGPLGDRGAADVYLKPTTDTTWRVWCVATVDKGEVGPYRALIYDAGRIVWDPARGLRFMRQDPRPLWVLEGLKVEALAEPAGVLGDSALSVGTDDEKHGGIWRALLAPRGG